MSTERPVFGGDALGGVAGQKTSNIRCIVTLAGEVVISAGEEPVPALVSTAGAMARDAERAARHLGFVRWEAMVLESDGGILGFAAAAPDADQVAVVGFARGTPAGAVQRAAARLAAGRNPQ
jgi:hypothetical protein